MSIKNLTVPVEIAIKERKERNEAVEAAINDAASILPADIRDIIISDVATMEEREFSDACIIHDNLQCRLSYLTRASFHYTRVQISQTKKFKSYENKIWRDLHGRFINNGHCINEYITQVYPIHRYTKELVASAEILYIKAAVEFYPYDF